jgi:hypothetical protein
MTIMGLFALVLFVPVLLWLKDLSPKLRLMVLESETTGEAFESGDLPHEAPATAMSAFNRLLSRWEVWLMVCGVVAFLTVAITIQTFGPIMFEQAFGYDHATADRLASYFWLLNGVMLVPAGVLSDWLGVRKPLSILLGILTLAILVWWTRHFYPPLSANALAGVTILLGAIAAAAFIPWTALYSEFVEDISPALQATGWSFFQLIYRTWVAFSAPLLTAVTAHYALTEAGTRHLIAPDQHAWSWLGDLDGCDGCGYRVVRVLVIRTEGVLETGERLSNCDSQPRGRCSGCWPDRLETKDDRDRCASFQPWASGVMELGRRFPKKTVWRNRIKASA